MPGFGGAVKLTGESEYRKALKQITQNLKEVDSELKLVASQYDKNDKSQEALTAQTDALSKKYDLQKERVETLKASLEDMTMAAEENKEKHEALKSELAKATEELEKIEKESGKASLEYETQAKYVSVLTEDYQKSQKAIDAQDVSLSNMKVELNKATAQMNTTDNTIKNLNEEMVKGSEDADKLGTEVEKAGNEAKSGSDGFTVMKAVVADLASTAIQAALNGLRQLGGAIVDAGRALADTSLEAASLADEVRTLSMQTGLNTSTIQELNYASELLDVSTSTVASSMSKLLRSMSSAQEGSGATAEAFSQMGIDITDASGNLRDNEEVFWDVIDYLGTLENESERDALAMQLLGRSAQELNPLIEQGSGAFRQLALEAHETGYVMDADTLGSFQALDDNMQRLSNGATAARNALGQVLLPALSSLSSQGISLLNNFTNALNGTNGDLSQIGSVIGRMLPQVTRVLQNIGRQVGSLLSTLIPQLIEQIPPLLETALPMLVSGVETVLNGVLSILPTIIPTIADLIPQAVGTLLNQLPTMVTVGVQLILELVRGISSAIPELLRQLPSIISETTQALIRLLPEIIQVGIELLMALIQGLTEALPLLINEIPVIIGTLCDTLLDPEMLNMIIQGGIELVMALITGLAEAVPALIEYAPTLVETLISVVTENLPGILQLGKDLLDQFIEGFQLVFGSLRAKCQEIFDIVWNKISELPRALFSIGENLVRGLINGVENMTQWAVDKIVSFGDSILSGLQDFFGIASPSKVFENEVGRYLAQGLGNGFVDEMANVTEQMRDAVPTSFDVSSGDISSVGSIGGGLDYYTLVNAFREALEGVDVQMDDVPMGRFVRKTVTDALYT